MHFGFFLSTFSEFHGNVAGDNRVDTPEINEDEPDNLYLDDQMEKLNLNDVSNVGEHFDGSYTRIEDV